MGNIPVLFDSRWICFMLEGVGRSRSAGVGVDRAYAVSSARATHLNLRVFRLAVRGGETATTKGLGLS